MKNNFLFGLNLSNLLLITCLIGPFVFGIAKSYEKFKGYKEGIKEIKEFYQKKGVCPTDSTSQDFVEWKELWNENFPKIK